MKSFKLLAILLPLLSLTSFSARSEPLEAKVDFFKLPNGMSFLLVPRKGAPVFTGYIRVKVGGADEKPGMTGIAHMLEHMAFKGTSTIGTRNERAEKKLLAEIEKIGMRLSELTRKDQGENDEAKKLKAQLKLLQQQAEVFVIKDEYSRAFTKNGGTDFNASTSKDLTSYFVELPIHKLSLWAYLSSEALKDPVFREFYQERDVVMEERRMRVEGDPFGKNYEEFLRTAFEKSPYKDPTIGYEKDIAALTATDLKNFYRRYYVPQNMVGAVVGDIDLAETKKILLKYFGSIPRGPDPPLLKEIEPEQKEERRTFVYFTARPQIMMGYHKPTLPHREDFVFDLIGEILCEGRTSRLYQSLVENKKIAQNIACDNGTPGARLDNLFFIYGSALGVHTPQELEAEIEKQVGMLRSTLVSKEELDRAKNQLIFDQLSKMNSNMGLAESLTYFQSVAGDWKYLIQHPKILEEITREEIREAARKYLVKSNQTISILSVPKKNGESRP